MFAFLGFGNQEMTVLLFMGVLVVVPLIVGIVAVVMDYRFHRGNRAE